MDPLYKFPGNNTLKCWWCSEMKTKTALLSKFVINTTKR